MRLNHFREFLKASCSWLWVVYAICLECHVLMWVHCPFTYSSEWRLTNAIGGNNGKRLPLCVHSNGRPCSSNIKSFLLDATFQRAKNRYLVTPWSASLCCYLCWSPCWLNDTLFVFWTICIVIFWPDGFFLEIDIDFIEGENIYSHAMMIWMFFIRDPCCKGERRILHLPTRRPNAISILIRNWLRWKLKESFSGTSLWLPVKWTSTLLDKVYAESPRT